MSGYVNPVFRPDFMGDAMPPQNRLASGFNAIWPSSNPVGTETTQGMQSATPTDQIAFMRPDGTPVMQSDLARAHEQVQTAMQVAPTMVLGMMGTTASMDNPAFAKWFGKSHVADESGQPLIVYKGMHPYDWTQETGTSRGPEIESINRTTEFPAFNKGEPGIKVAGFFSDNPAVASHFAAAGGTGGAVYPVHLSFQNPHIIDAAGEKAGNIQFGEPGKAFREAVRSGKYDSVIIRNTADEGNVYIALRPEQVKSAIGNRGTYDPNDPRMIYGAGGLAAGATAAGTQQQSQ